MSTSRYVLLLNRRRKLGGAGASSEGKAETEAEKEDGGSGKPNQIGRRRIGVRRRWRFKMAAIGDPEVVVAAAAATAKRR